LTSKTDFAVTHGAKASAVSQIAGCTAPQTVAEAQAARNFQQIVLILLLFADGQYAAQSSQMRSLPCCDEPGSAADGGCRDGAGEAFPLRLSIMVGAQLLFVRETVQGIAGRALPDELEPSCYMVIVLASMAS